MKQLTKKQKVFVLKEMIRYYKNVKRGDARAICGLVIGISMKDLNVKGPVITVSDVFPEIVENRPNYNFYWWTWGSAQPRLNYCKKILKLIESK